ncbi:hypothetical protein GCM10027037_14180 [Mucilaginibacter koreensis]
MKAFAALVLHVLSVHYLFVFFVIGVPALIAGLMLRKKPVVKRYGVAYLFYFVFIACLLGSKLFPALNEWYLNRYGMPGEAVVVSADQEPAWFRRTPEVRLLLKIVPNVGPPFTEVVNAAPSLEVLDSIQVGTRLQVLYAPQYTHDIMVSSWKNMD